MWAEFWNQCQATLGQLAERVSPAVYQQGDLYLNRRLGLAFTAPAGWRFVNVAEMGDVQAGQFLDVRSHEENAALLASMELPFVALAAAQAEEHDDEGSLGIQFYLVDPPGPDLTRLLLHAARGEAYRPSPELDFSAPLQVIRRDWQCARGMLHDLRVSELPKETCVAGLPAAEYTAGYSFRHRQLQRRRRLCVRSIAMEHGPRFYLLRLIHAEGESYDFTPFLASLRFT